MRHHLLPTCFHRGAIARRLRPSALAFGVAGAAVFGQACAPTFDESQSPDLASLSIEEALSAIESCQAEASACFGTADNLACEEKLRSCLVSILPDGGGAPPRADRDGGRPADPASDGGKDNPREDGATPPDRPSPDAGHRELPDAAKRALTDPVGNDGGPAVHACVNDLRACLASDAKPSACAEDSRACLAALRNRDGG